MKKTRLLMLLLCLSLILVSYFTVKSEKDKTNSDYVYTGEKEFTLDGRSYKLEDIPENSAEEIVALNFLYTISAKYDELLEITADLEAYRISVSNEEKDLKEGTYIQSFVIHNISTLTEEEYGIEKLDSGDANPLYYYGWESSVKRFDLTEYEVINVDFTQVLSESSARGQQ